MELKNGTLLQNGKYRIERFISSGGFGCTYEAFNVYFKERVAIKEFFVKDFCNREENTSYVYVGTHSKRELVERLKNKFIDEAIILHTIHHSNIVNVKDVFEENGTAYYVMDYIDGKSLDKIIEKQGKLSEMETLGYIRQIADTLRYIHSKNILHLDIKPGNIMIDVEDNAILIDFGTSKQYDEVDGENTSTLMGRTPGYAPPEQMCNAVVKFTPVTDIYALGATMYKLLTGKTPPDSNLRTSGEVYLKPLPKDISNTTTTAIYKSLSLNKKERFQSVGDFMDMLWNEEEKEDIDLEKTLPLNSDKMDAHDTSIKLIRLEKENARLKKNNTLKLIIVSIILIIICTGWTLFIYDWLPFQYADEYTKSENIRLEKELTEIKSIVSDVENNLSEIRKAEGLFLIKCDTIVLTQKEQLNKEFIQIKDHMQYNRAMIESLSISLEKSNKDRSYLRNQIKKHQSKYEKSTNLLKKIIESHTTIKHGTINGYEYVDLGLPSGIKWASCNVGAVSPEDYGNQYCWGDTRTDYGLYASSVTYGKNIGDIKGDSQYDVARLTWGGSWRLPTSVEMEELVNNCFWEWTEHNGTEGYNVTGLNGNSIFLPALLSYSEYGGCYWSSTPNGNDLAFYLHGSKKEDPYVTYHSKSIRCNIRPVSE